MKCRSLLACSLALLSVTSMLWAQEPGDFLDKNLKLVPNEVRDEVRFQEPWVPRYMWAGAVAKLFGGTVLEPRFDFMALAQGYPGGGFGGMAGSNNGYNYSQSPFGNTNGMGNVFNNGVLLGGGTSPFGGNRQTGFGQGFGRDLGAPFGVGGNRRGFGFGGG